jgi:S-adenosylmethionine:tRNA ribosyltransferase-isomerase
VSALAFELPPALEASEPPEARGLRRDEVRLMVARNAEGVIEDATFARLAEFLRPGDVVVVNTSATLPAAIAARRADGSPLRVHVATAAPHLPEGWWVLELRSADGAHPLGSGRAGERLELAGGAIAELVAPYASGARLMLARLELDELLVGYLKRHGEPIRYGYVPERWPVSAYQTVYANQPGSAEMPSAGRPFTAELLAELVSHGVLIAPILLHTGVSSPEGHEPPYPEYYEVPAPTATLVERVREWGGRVVAVGTTVVRALETVATPEGKIEPGSGWTNLVVKPERGLWTVDALLTGWHEPRASHLQLLGAVADAELLSSCYRRALERGYLWHEFGDSHLLLP